VQCYSWWTFSDIFAENYFSSVPFHGGFGLLTINGIAKPTYRAFQLLGRLGDERLLVDGTHATVDATVVRGKGEITVLLTNHAFPKHPIATQQVTLELACAEPPTAMWLERIDDDHGNPRKLWQSLGSPEYPDADQMQRLHDASICQREPLTWRAKAGSVSLDVSLPPHAVAAITLQLAS
jgi:xylan 1,4-beta-xylosidase